MKETPAKRRQSIKRINTLEKAIKLQRGFSPQQLDQCLLDIKTVMRGRRRKNEKVALIFLRCTEMWLQNRIASDTLIF